MNTPHLAFLVEKQAQQYGHRAELYFRDRDANHWRSISWKRLHLHTCALADALCGIGLPEYGKVAVFSPNLWELIATDFATYRNHATLVPLYATSTLEQVVYILNDCEAQVLFAGAQYQYDIAVQALQQCPSLQHIVAIDATIDLRGCDRSYRFSELLELGQHYPNQAETDRRLASCSQDDLINILYTSGTTGTPKGVMLHQYNYTECLRIHRERIHTLTDKDTSLCFLPLTHVFERGWTYVCMDRGTTLYINRNPADVQRALVEVRPTVMCSVPRLWEKVYAALQNKIEQFPYPLRLLMLQSIQVGREYNLQYKRYGLRAPKRLALRYQFLAKPLFHLVYKVVGIDKGKLFPVAGARLSDEINEFLHAIGLNICIGYGLTETTATVSCYLPEGQAYIINSIGRIMPELQVRIAGDGEIQLKGKTITAGYYHRDEANREAFTADGWFRTGDAGYLDADNNLYITDRIKDLFKTAGGKYIAPQALENLLCLDKYIDQAAIIGNERKYVTALLVPDYEQLEAYANAHNLPYTSRTELVALPAINDLFQGIIDQKNHSLARYEQIKYFTLLAEPFTLERGLLTNTLKIKRKVVEQLFAREIEYMYNK